MKALMGTLRKEAIVGVTCWELKSHLFKALVLPTFIYGIEIWGGDLKNYHWKAFKKMHIMSHVKVRSFDYLPYFVGRIWRTSHIIICSQAYYRLSTMAWPPTPLLVSK